VSDASNFDVDGDLDALDAWLEQHGWGVNRELLGANGGIVLHRWADWSLAEAFEGNRLAAVTRPDLTTGISAL
jgi:hypothetical protein